MNSVSLPKAISSFRILNDKGRAQGKSFEETNRRVTCYASKTGAVIKEQTTELPAMHESFSDILTISTAGPEQ